MAHVQAHLGRAASSALVHRSFLSTPEGPVGKRIWNRLPGPRGGGPPQGLSGDGQKSLLSHPPASQAVACPVRRAAGFTRFALFIRLSTGFPCQDSSGPFKRLEPSAPLWHPLQALTGVWSHTSPQQSYDRPGLLLPGPLELIQAFSAPQMPSYRL